MRKTLGVFALVILLALLAAWSGACSGSADQSGPSGPGSGSDARTSTPAASPEPSSTQPPGSGGGEGGHDHVEADEVGNFRITSPAFANGAEIPSKFTCNGADVSPPVQWSAVPDGTQSLALVVVDPDASQPGGFTHWVLTGLDPPGGGVGEATTEGVAGSNDAGTRGWSGPCPPSGTHTYVFTIYAFDHATDFGSDPTRAAVEAEPGQKGVATLTGTYG